MKTVTNDFKSLDRVELGKSVRLLGILSAIYFLIEFVPNWIDGYGYFIDELYYIACSNRPALGYVDHPPLSTLILALWKTLFGTSLGALRFLPALYGAATVFLTGWIARGLGAGRFGQALAALAYMTAAVPLILFGFYSMNALQLLIWALLLCLLVEIGRTGNSRLWIWFGLLAGFGLLNKHTMVLMAAGLAAGLILTPARRFLTEKHLWLGAGLGLIVLLPNLLWQFQNGWPSLEFYRNAAMMKNLPSPPLEVLKAQVLYMNPVAAAAWVPGLLFLLLSPRMKRWRFLGWLFLTLLALLVVSQQSRPDRITGVYPVLFGAGAVFWDVLWARRPWAWFRVPMMGVLILSGLILIPLGVPILPPAQTAAYAGKLGMVPQMERGEGKKSELPQWFADRFGWEQLVVEVAGIYEGLPQEEKDFTVILAPSYGQAGALELLGSRYGLPPVVSPHNNYYLWGLPDREIRTVIAVGFGTRSLSQVFETVEEVGVYHCDYCMRWRDDMPLFLARSPRLDLRQAWAGLKRYE